MPGGPLEDVFPFVHIQINQLFCCVFRSFFAIARLGERQRDDTASGGACDEIEEIRDSQLLFLTAIGQSFLYEALICRSM